MRTSRILHCLLLLARSSALLDWPQPYPQCPAGTLNSIAGCNYTDIAPPRVLKRVNEILLNFIHNATFRGCSDHRNRRNQTSCNHSDPRLLWGKTAQEQLRLKIKLLVLWHTLETLRPNASAIVELGTFVGTTAMGLRMVMDELGYRYPHHVLHVYDSWQGLPPPTKEDRGTGLGQGGLTSSIDAYLDRFAAAGLDPPYIHKGFFGAIPASQYPDNIAFAFYDVTSMAPYSRASNGRTTRCSQAARS